MSNAIDFFASGFSLFGESDDTFALNTLEGVKVGQKYSQISP